MASISRPLGVLLLAALSRSLSAQQRPDTVGARDTSRTGHATRPLAPVVITGSRLAGGSDPRLPQHVVGVARTAVPQGLNSAAELLQRIPGVSVSNDQGSRAQPTLNVRGFFLSPVVGVAQGVSVFLDGVRVNEPDAQEVNLDLLPMEAVEHAQLTSGASAVLGKNTLAGALDLRTARGGATPEIRGEVSAGSFGERAAHVLASGQRGGFDGVLLAKATSDQGYQALSGGTTRQLFSTLGRSTSTSDAAVSLLYSYDRIYEAGSLPESWLTVTRRANYTGGDFFRPELLQLSLRASLLRSHARWQGSFFARRNAIEQFNVNVSGPDTRALIDNRSVGGTGELAVTTRISGRSLDLTFGAEAAHSRVGYQVFAESAPGDAVATSDCEPTSDTTSALCEHARVSGDDAGAYAQAVLHASDRLSILLSARGDYARVPFHDLRDAANDGTSIFRRFSPKLGATFLATTNLRIYASVGSAFRAPAALELACASPQASCPLPFALGADPPLRPVVAWSYEAGTDWSPGGGTNVTLSLFHVDVHDEIVFASAERAAGYFQNVARTRRDGVEVSFARALVSGVRTFGSYSFVDATYRTQAPLASALDDNVVTRGSRFALSPRHRATVGLGATHVTPVAVLDVTMTARGVSSTYLRGDEANRRAPLAGYVVNDLQLRAQRGRVTASVLAGNLFDTRYATFGVYAMNPKGAYGGPPPVAPAVERFLTPGYPRTVTVSLGVER